jgi:hypothetical protein
MSDKKNKKTKYEDKKIDYILKTFSRTNKKDYENYVINAIWNRLISFDSEYVNLLKPVSQQYVETHEKDKYRFIDLYFPQLNLGVEVNEPFHENQRVADMNREQALHYTLTKIRDNEYEQIKIEITKNTTFTEIEEKINKIVNIIHEKIGKSKLTY